MSLESGDPRWSSLREDGSELPREEHPAAIALRTGRPVRDVTLGVHRPDGSVVWLLVSAEPLGESDNRDEGPTVGGVVTTFTDVTASRAAAAALRRSEEQFRHAMALAPIGMALVELDGHFREVNLSLARLVGYEEDELIGLTFQQITHPEDLEADLDNIAHLLDGSLDHYAMEKRYVTKTGEIVWVHLAVSMATDDHDHPAYFIAQIQDITDSRATQERLAHRDGELRAGRVSVVGLRSGKRNRDTLPSVRENGQRHDVTEPQVHGRGVRRLLPVDDGRAVVAPDRQRQRVATDLLHDPRHPLACQLDRVDAGQRRQSQLEGGGPEVVAGIAGVLRHQFQPLEAHQVAMRLGCTHAGGGCQVAQHQRSVGLAQHVQQTESDLDRLNAGTLLHCQSVPLELRLGKFISQCVMCWDSSASAGGRQIR